MPKMPKYGAIGLANHFGCDVETIRESEYQPGQYSQKIFSFDSDGSVFYCPYKTKAKSVYDSFFDEGIWEKFQSSYDSSVYFWKFIPTD
jgi:hypothetical protein